VLDTQGHSSIMYCMTKELLEHIEACAWDPHTSDEEKVLGIQNLLYQWGQILDKRTENVYGSDQHPLHDEESPYPNMRRC